MRWDTQIGGSMTGADLGVYSMHESSDRVCLYYMISWVEW